MIGVHWISLALVKFCITDSANIVLARIAFVIIKYNNYALLTQPLISGQLWCTFRFMISTSTILECLQIISEIKNSDDPNFFACGEAEEQPALWFPHLQDCHLKLVELVARPEICWAKPSLCSGGEDEAAYQRHCHLPNPGQKDPPFAREVFRSGYQKLNEGDDASTSYELATHICSPRVSVFPIPQHSEHAASKQYNSI